MRNTLSIEWNDEGAVAIAEGFPGVMLTCPRCKAQLPRGTEHRCGVNPVKPKGKAADRKQREAK
jgi:hypothetical protein